MKSFKITAIVAAVFLALGAFIYFYEIKGEQKRKEEEKRQKDIFSFNEDEADEFTLMHSGETFVVKKGENDEWMIESPMKLRADDRVCKGVIRAFNDVTVSRVVADSVSNLADFGLEKPEIKATFKLNGVPQDTLFIGDESVTGGRIFARKSGSDRVFLISSIYRNRLKKGLYDLRDKRVLAFDRNEVRKIEVKKRGKPAIVCAKDADGNWMMKKPVEDRGDKGKIDNFLVRLKDGRAKEFVDESPRSLARYGLHRPYLKISLWIGDEMAKKSLIIGGEAPDGRRYAKDVDRPRVFKVDSSFVKWMDVTPYDLRYKGIIEFTRSKIDKIEIFYPDSLIVCQKNPGGDWRITAPVVKPARNGRIGRMMTRLLEAEAKKFVSEHPRSLRPYGLDKPRIHAKFWEGSEIAAEIMIGKKIDNTVYAKTDMRDAVYLIRSKIADELSFTLDKLVDKSREKKLGAETSSK